LQPSQTFLTVAGVRIVSAVDYVTATAAALAAILSGVNLWLTGRRELNRWARDTLVESLVTFFDTSFKLRSSCRELISLAKTDKAKIQARVKIIAAHDLETDTLTRLRLLAPSKIVVAAEALHEADHAIADAYFSIDPETSFELALVRTRAARVEFIRAARLAFRLRDMAAISHRHNNTSWWKLRDTTVALLEQQAAESPEA